MSNTNINDNLLTCNSKDVSELLKAFGVTQKAVTSFNLNISAMRMPTVRIEYYPDTPDKTYVSTIAQTFFLISKEEYERQKLILDNIQILKERCNKILNLYLHST